MKKILREALIGVDCANCEYEHNITHCEYCQLYYSALKYKPTRKYVEEIISQMQRREKNHETE